MPFVAEIGECYLVRLPNVSYSQKRRRLTRDLNEATVWSKRGHAKSAVTAAISAGSLPKSVKFSIREVVLALVEEEP